MMIVLPVRDMRACERVTKFLREPKVDDVYARFRGVPRRHDKIRWLDVAMHKAARVDVFYAVELKTRLRRRRVRCGSQLTSWTPSMSTVLSEK